MRVVGVSVTSVLLFVALLAPVGALTAPTAIEPLTAPASDAAWARALVASFDRATAVNDADGDKVWDTLEHRFLTTPRLDVVVTFAPGTSTADGLAAAKRAVPTLAPLHTFSIVPGFAATLSHAESLRLGLLPQVRQIEYDHPAVPELDTATAMFGADIVVDAAGITGDRDGDETNYTTDDVVIAILDTGFNAEHVDLDGGKILHFHDLDPDPQATPYDDGGHGSHVAGIAAGTGEGDPLYRGVAPGAAIVGIKIVAGSSLSNAITGFEWIVAQRDNFSIDIATISFGFGTTTDGTSALELAVDKAWDAGITAFKSTGNSGPGQGTVTIPGGARGILATGSMLATGRASLPTANVAALTSLASDGGFLLSDYSSRGPTTDGRIKPDIVAPGQGIMAVDYATTDGYTSKSGTSMASPFAAGTAALLLDANPALTPDEIRDILFATAEDWGRPGPDVDYGNGRIRVDLAVAEALARAGGNATFSVPIHPVHEMFSGTIGLPYTEFTVQVNDTAQALALTIIAEGLLAQVLVLDPDMTPVVSGDLPISRQHQLGFNPSTPGAYTVRLIGQSGAEWVADVTHGVVPDATDVPSFDGSLEAAAEAAPPLDEPVAVPGAAALIVVLAVLGLIAAARRGAPHVSKGRHP